MPGILHVPWKNLDINVRPWSVINFESVLSRNDLDCVNACTCFGTLVVDWYSLNIFCSFVVLARMGRLCP